MWRALDLINRLIKFAAMMNQADSPLRPAEGTARALIEAAIPFFGTKGFAATSTREIAAAAGTNVASIAYHFGGKDGLRLACAREFAARVQSIVIDSLPTDEPASAEAATAILHAMIERVAPQIIANPQLRAMISFVLREVAENSAGAQQIYDMLIFPLHSRLCRLWGAATGQAPESVQVRLTVFSVIGQMLYFRIGGPIVARRMGWDEIGGPNEVRQIIETLKANIDAILAATRGGAR